MPWLRTLRLLNVAHVAPVILQAVCHRSSGIQGVELAGCNACLRPLLQTLGPQGTSLLTLNGITILLGDETSEWSACDDRLEIQGLI